MGKLEDSRSLKVTLRLEAAMVDEIDKLAAGRGVSRSECVRELLSKALLAKNENMYGRYIAALVRAELDGFRRDVRGDFLAAAEDALETLESQTRDSLDELRDIAGASLWLHLFDEYMTEGAHMDDWHKLAMRKSSVVGFDRLVADFDPEGGVR